MSFRIFQARVFDDYFGGTDAESMLARLPSIHFYQSPPTYPQRLTSADKDDDIDYDWAHCPNCKLMWKSEEVPADCCCPKCHEGIIDGCSTRTYWLFHKTVFMQLGFL